VRSSSHQAHQQLKKGGKGTWNHSFWKQETVQYGTGLDLDKDLVVAVPGTGDNWPPIPGRLHGFFCKDSKLFAFETQSSDVLEVPEPDTTGLGS
jgi:hypothetical protein